jgi:hypothetical protein
MNTRFPRISLGNLGLLCAAISFSYSVYRIFVAFTLIGHDRTVTLTGFMTYSVSDGTLTTPVVLSYLLFNTVFGMVCGFLLAWFYNFLTQPPGSIATGRNQL